MSGRAEVAFGVFQRRYDPLDTSICVVRDGGGLLLVDTPLLAAPGGGDPLASA